MPFTLHVVFSGLCLFVPESANGRDKLHVLMPNTESDCAVGNGGVELHLPRLYYDAAYETGGGAGSLGKKFARVPLEGRALDLSTLATSDPLDVRLPDVFNIKFFTKTNVKHDALASGNAAREVGSRVTLGGGKCTDHCRGATWIFHDGGTPYGPYRMAHVVRWSVVLDQADLSWGLDLLRGKGNESLPTLQPINSGKGLEIVISILHLPPRELPVQGKMAEDHARGREQQVRASPRPAIAQCQQALHFAAYYCGFDNPKSKPLPECHDPTPDGCSLQKLLPRGLDLPVGIRGEEMTCMLLQANDSGAP